MTNAIKVFLPEAGELRVTEPSGVLHADLSSDGVITFRISSGEQGPPGPYDIRSREIDSSPNTVIDYALGAFQSINVIGDIGTIDVLNWPPPGKAARLILELRQTSAFQIAAWPEGTRWVEGVRPVLTVGAGSTDLVVLTTGTAGDVVFGNVVGQNYQPE